MGRTAGWLITIAVSVLVMAGCVLAADTLLPWDQADRVVVGTALGLAVDAVVGLWAASLIADTADTSATSTTSTGDRSGRGTAGTSSVTARGMRSIAAHDISGVAGSGDQPTIRR